MADVDDLTYVEKVKAVRKTKEYKIMEVDTALTGDKVTHCKKCAEPLVAYRTGNDEYVSMMYCGKCAYQGSLRGSATYVD